MNASWLVRCPCPRVQDDEHLTEGGSRSKTTALIPHRTQFGKMAELSPNYEGKERTKRRIWGRRKGLWGILWWILGSEGAKVENRTCEWVFDECSGPGYWGVLFRLIKPPRWMYLCSKHEEAQARSRIIKDWHGGVKGWKE